MESLHLWVARCEVDVAEDVLWQLGVIGIETREHGDDEVELVAAPGDHVQAERFWQELHDRAEGRWRWERRIFDSSAANHAWRPHATVSRIGDVLIRPVWLAKPEHAVAIDLEPGDGWGHGAHPSTVLAGELVQRLMDRSSSATQVLDVGCGSGVLSLVAAQRGAVVTAVDLEVDAVVSTSANAARNGWANRIDACTVEQFEARRCSDTSFALVVANVGIWVVDEFDEWIASMVEPDGHVVLSGLLLDQIDRVRNAEAWHGWREVDVHHDGYWAAIALQRLSGAERSAGPDQR